MAGSFGGSVKLTGESEYTKALKTITSNLTVMASEMKLVSSEYNKNDKSVQAITSRNTILNKQIEESNKKVDTYKKALEDFNKQQDKNAHGMMQMMMTLEKEKAKLEELKSSTTATSKEIKDQEKVVTDLATQLASAESQYDKNKITMNKYQKELNLAKTEVNNLTQELEDNKKTLSTEKDAYTKLTDKINDQKARLNELKTQYGSITLEQGKSSSEAKNLKNKIKDLSSEIKNNESKLDKSTSAINKFTGSEKEAEKETIKFGDIIKAHLTSTAIIAGIKGLAKAMGQVVKGAINLGKEAIKNYAEFEQLVGGVETLFGAGGQSVEEYAKSVGKSVTEVQGEYDKLMGSQKLVLDNSKKAYKTAGLSANEYMNTVTSFSASLLQSLNGDTAKSAEIADMAIIDMADNANKMGTNMGMIQSAYQGFAKQNYTMLDNLKLGYGGTKTEMERLLKDAEKLSGQKYNIKNLNDVYQAIHVVQEEMGISGTTAKEASSTISGSISSMKSAWQNLITGIADDNADFSTLISNFVESIMTMANNIVPRISVVLDGLVNLVLELADKLLPQVLDMGVNLIKNLVTGIGENIGNLMEGMNKVINTIITTLIQILPQIINTGIQIITSLISGIAKSLPTLIPQLVQCVILMVETLLDNIGLIIDTGIQLILGLVEGIMNAIPELIDKIPIIIDKLITAITDNLPKIIEMGIILIVKLAVGLIKAIPKLLLAIPKIIVSLVEGIANYYSKLKEKGGEILGKIKDGIISGVAKLPEVGRNLVVGLWNGINNAKEWILKKIKGFGKSILNGIKSFFGIKSPSTVFKDQVGKNLALGLSEGFTDEMDNVKSDIENALPKDFDLGINANIENQKTLDSNFSKDLLIASFKEALSGMTFKAFDETFGELVIENVEKVVYS